MAMEKENQIRNEIIEGRNAVIEALRAGRAIDKIFMLFTSYNFSANSSAFSHIASIL